jgi:D-alanine-D-alanine ligase-like ATP-grasp enzyme
MIKFKSKKLFASILIIILIIISVFAIYIYSKSNPAKNITDSSTSESTSSSYYSDLYGTWVITKHIPSNIKTLLSDSMVSFCIGQKFTVEEDKITSLFSIIQNPSIVEGIMTASNFTKKYNHYCLINS